MQVCRTLGVNAAGVTFECLEEAGFEDDFVKFYNRHIGTSCDGAGVGLKFEDAYGATDTVQRNREDRGRSRFPARLISVFLLR